jgi:hypothetical protein
MTESIPLLTWVHSYPAAEDEAARYSTLSSNGVASPLQS